VTLAQAESDKFYRVDTDPNLPAEPDTIEGLMAERHLRLPAKTEPAVQLDALCR
jgi:hypothetical protein